MSSSNNKWEIAVAVPIKNSYFRYKNRFSATIADIPNTSITLSGLQTESDASISHASEVMAANDRIMLKGTTSKTVDTTTISSVPTTGLVIVTADNMSGDFAIGDTIVGYGNAVPGGWYLTGYDPSSGMAIDRSTGSFDNFSIVLYLPAVNILALYLKQSLSTDNYKQYLRYRLGCIYKYIKVIPDEGASFKMGIISNSSTKYVTIREGVSSSVSSWTSVSTSNVYLSDSSISSFDISFWAATHDQETVDTTYIYIDEVYLEHVYNSVSEKTIYGSTAADSGKDAYVGYYEIDTWADAGSIKWREIEQNSEVILLDKSLEWYDPTGWGERNTKYELTAQFTNVNSDIFDKLEALKRIQKNGYSLNLHPYLDELPSVITGKMYLEGVDYTYWDYNMVSFSFRFREA
uniref:Uncharacterized protein n=1 Tax=viral metagenome TaxID=1070528 RepID=A0A6H1ZLI2_9ZZZZ